MDICIFYKHHFQSTKQEKTIYCYSDEERKVAIENWNQRNHRFKGLGEISPDEFKILLEKLLALVMMDKTHRSNNCCLSTWVKNARPEFIIKNLKVELDVTDAV
jgi:topoisomerase-4 subunit B